MLSSPLSHPLLSHPLLSPLPTSSLLTPAQVLTLHLDTPEKWLVECMEATYDMDNIRLTQLGDAQRTLAARYVGRVGIAVQLRAWHSSLRRSNCSGRVASSTERPLISAPRSPHLPLARPICPLPPARVSRLLPSHRNQVRALVAAHHGRVRGRLVARPAERPAGGSAPPPHPFMCLCDSVCL